MAPDLCFAGALGKSILQAFWRHAGSVLVTTFCLRNIGVPLKKEEKKQREENTILWFLNLKALECLFVAQMTSNFLVDSPCFETDQKYAIWIHFPWLLLSHQPRTGIC